MTMKIIKESDIIKLPGLTPARVGIAQHNGKYLTFTAKVVGDRQEPIPSSIMPASTIQVAQKQYAARIRALEGL